MVWLPIRFTVGANTPELLTPFPLQVPPAGEADKLNGLAFEQTGDTELILTLGPAFTVTVFVAEFTQPFCEIV